MNRSIAAALAFFALGGVALANEDQDNLQAMHMLAASKAICGFPMNVSEEARLGKAVTFLEKKLKYDSARASAYYAEVAKAFEAEKDSLCAKDGEWRKTYGSALAGLPE
jgi:hypothetical protein